MPPPRNAHSADSAREYLRVSHDRSGNLQSPAEQHDDNQRAAGANGWTLGDPYAETEAVSASRYASKARAAFDRLTADLASGAFGARILILWESSRGSRKVREWVDLIDACEAACVLVHVTTHGRTYDPANSRDRRSLLEDAVDSEYESAKLSDRARRAQAAHAAAGRPSGRIPYGYTRTYDPVTRRLVSQDPHLQEAPVVAELFDRLRAGHTLKAIARDFTERGITRRTGQPFSRQHLRELAMQPAYAGLRVHQPVTGPRDRRNIDGAVPAVWPAIVAPEVWHSVHAMLTDPARRTTRPGRARHLLSLIAVCGVCNGPLTVTYRFADARRYSCRDRSCVMVVADDLDQHATDVMLTYLAQPDIASRLRAHSADDDALAQVRGDLAAARGELADWRRGASEGRVTLASFAAVEPGIAGRISDLEAAERHLSAPPELAGLITPGEDAAQSWAAAPMSARRRVARLLCSPPILGTLCLDRDPTPGRNHAPAARRVRWQR